MVRRWTVPLRVLAAAGGVVRVQTTATGWPDMRAPTWDRSGPRLTARAPAVPPVPTDPRPGLRALDPGVARGTLLYVPPGMGDGRPARLVLVLHGAGGDARSGLGPLAPLADAHRLLLLAPASRGSTWDVIVGGWGPDVRR